MNISHLLQKIISDRKHLFLVFLVTILLSYLPVINGPFIFDDEFLIQRNTLIKDISNIPQFFVKSSTDGAFISNSNFYRPLQAVSYTILNSLFGIRPTPFHLLSITLHFINVVLIYTFLTRFKLKKEYAFLFTLMFAIHPVNTQAVSYIAGIADPLGLMFTMLASIYFIDNRKDFKPKNYIVLSVFFILALLSKENTVVLPLILFLIYEIEFVFTKNKLKKNYQPLIIISIISIIYLFLKFTVFNFTGASGLTSASNIYTENIIVRILSFVASLGDYFLLTIFPVNLYYEKPYIATVGILDLRLWIGVIIIGFILYLFGNAYQKKRQLSMLGLLMLGGFFIPFIGIIPLNAVFLEHWLYFPLVGVVLFLTDHFSNLTIKNNELILRIICIIIIIFGLRTFTRNIQWANPKAFFENEYYFAPNSGRIINNLAMQYSNEGNQEKAIEMFKNASRAEPLKPEAFHNVGNSYLKIKDYKRAEEYLLIALDKDPNFIYSLYALRQLHTETGNTIKAKKFEELFNKVYNGEKITKEEINAIK